VVVRRYRPSEEGSVELSSELSSASSRARREVAEVLDVDDIIEIVRRAEPEVVEAAVLEMKDEGFELDARTLVRLDDAGARPGLIDLMVALSYPDQFEVGHETPGDEGVAAGGFSLLDALGSPYPYYAAPFGYYYWYNPYRPIWVVRPSSEPDSGSIRVGRVIRGQGYTRVTRSESGGGSGYRSGSGGAESWSAGSSGSANRGGYSNSGGSTRTAKPKQK
jgi:hypothetical protein